VASKVVSRHIGTGVLPSGTPVGGIPPSPQNQNKISSAFLKEVIERLNAAASKVVSRHVGTGVLPAGTPAGGIPPSPQRQTKMSSTF